MDEETRGFFEWADDAGIEPDKASYMCWKAGRDSLNPTVQRLRQEIIRLHEIIRDRNHDMGLG